MLIRINNDISLDRFLLSDCEALVKNFKNDEIRQWLFDLPNPYTLEHAKQWVTQNDEQYKRDKLAHHFVLRSNHTREYIGSIGMKMIFADDPNRDHQVEIGYLIIKEHWGKGHATAMVETMTDYIFQNFDFQRIFACVFAGNQASEKVLLKAGYKEEGLLRQFGRKGSNYLDVKIFARLKNDL